ncbi:MAG: helix-turn-helix transcriptional regulator [Gammaproteobacteria bacterium]|nr:helix-turn-helix transcriptional regulator [Gammaproteobacteria bacterium]
MNKKVELIVPKNHISISSVVDINEICQPLFQHTDINFFLYGRIYNDDSAFCLSNNVSVIEDNLSSLKDKTFSWNSVDTLAQENSSHINRYANQSVWMVKNTLTNKLMNHYNNLLQIGNGIEIAEKFTDYYEIVWFDSYINKDLIGFYFSNLEILEHFILYFREKASKIIKEAEQHKISPNRDQEYQSFIQQNANIQHVDGTEILTLSNKIQLKRYPISIYDKTTNLSSKEFNCLYYLARGYSQKEIGRTCGISDRTVESHLDKIKGKLNIYNKKKLIELFYASRLARLKPIIDKGDKR